MSDRASRRPRTVALMVIVFTLLSLTIIVFSGRPDITPGTSAGRAAESGQIAGSDSADDPYFPDYGNGGYDVVSYQIDLDFDPVRQFLNGRTVVRAQAKSTLRSFYLDLALTAHRVQVGGADASSTKENFQDLRITPAKPVQVGQEFTVTVDYSGRPGEVHRKGVGGDNDSPVLAGRDEWLIVGEPESAAWWYPANDHPSDPARFDISIRVPSKYQAITVGALLSKDTELELGFDTWHWRLNEQAPTYATFLAVGRYSLREGTAAGRPYVYAVSDAFSLKQRDAMFRVLSQTPRAVRELEAILGSYPYGQLGGLATATPLDFAGLEAATRPVYAGLALPSEFGDELVIHEQAHMWFGDRVTLRQWKDIFNNEGLASWAYWEVVDRRGGQTAEHTLERAYAETRRSPGFWRTSMTDPGTDELFDTVYLRGPMAVQALHNVLGDAAFDDLIRAWARAGGPHSLEDFMAAAQARTTVDLQPFFKEWLSDRDAPAETAANGLSS